MPVVPEPPKGSSTVPPSGQPANTHGSIRSLGKVAKCAPLNAFVVTVHTDLLFLLKSLSFEYLLVLLIPALVSPCITEPTLS